MINMIFIAVFTSNKGNMDKACRLYSLIIHRYRWANSIFSKILQKNKRSGPPSTSPALSPPSSITANTPRAGISTRTINWKWRARIAKRRFLSNTWKPSTVWVGRKSASIICEQLDISADLSRTTSNPPSLRSVVFWTISLFLEVSI